MSAAVAARRGATAPARRGATRRALGLLVALAALAATAGASLAVGAKAIPLATVLDALLHHDPEVRDELVVRTQRLPRTLLGVEVGVALALAGALMQGLTRNPLADPGLLGVNAGAALAVVLGVSLLGVTGVGGAVWLALVGAAVAAAAVYAVGAAGRGGPTPVRLVLAGAAVTALLQGGVVQAFLVVDAAAFESFRAWNVGALAGRDLAAVGLVGPAVAVGTVLALALAPTLNALALGDEAAAGVGARVGAARLLGALAVALLCGAATAAAGPIGFVGLAVPYAVRAFAGPDQRWAMPYALLLGPVLVLGADVLGRIAPGDGELPVGLVCAFLGAPVFIALARRGRLARL